MCPPEIDIPWWVHEWWPSDLRQKSSFLPENLSNVTCHKFLVNSLRKMPPNGMVSFCCILKCHSHIGDWHWLSFFAADSQRWSEAPLLKNR